MESTREICRLYAEMLSYPGEELRPSAEDCLARLGPFEPAALRPMERFCAFVAESDGRQLEELYTATFDLQPLCSPYIAYHLCGEGQQRGQFMVKLREVYRQGGHAEGRELPDHLAEVLRFLTVSEDEPGRQELIDDGLIPALEKMLCGFSGEDHPYAEVLRSLRAFLGGESAAGIPDPRVPEKEMAS